MKNLLNTLFLDRFWSSTLSVVSLLLLALFIGIDNYITKLSFLPFTNAVFLLYPLVVFVVNMTRMFLPKK
jgi:hypothetical protein